MADPSANTMALTTNIDPGLSELMSHGPIETEVIAEMEPTVDANLQRGSSRWQGRILQLEGQIRRAQVLPGGGTTNGCFKQLQGVRLHSRPQHLD